MGTTWEPYHVARDPGAGERTTWREEYPVPDPSSVSLHAIRVRLEWPGGRRETKVPVIGWTTDGE